MNAPKKSPNWHRLSAIHSGIHALIRQAEDQLDQRMDGVEHEFVVTDLDAAIELTKISAEILHGDKKKRRRR